MKYKLQEAIEESGSFTKDMLIEVLKQGDSVALALTEPAVEENMYEISASEGALLCPEGSATYDGLKKLIEKDWADNEEITLGANISVG